MENVGEKLKQIQILKGRCSRKREESEQTQVHGKGGLGVGRHGQTSLLQKEG